MLTIILIHERVRHYHWECSWFGSGRKSNQTITI